uniref:Uncharacterized protein n=1 Tax=Panagrolaimus sp. JU765 TaxID=591449 RepID=A0AC34QB27_9BILA
MCQIFAYLLLLVSINGGLSSSIDDVKTMMTEFFELSKQTIGDAELLAKISSRTAKFFESAAPIAALVASSMKIDFQRDSDEYKAIELLRSEMHQQFETLEMRSSQDQTYFEGIILPNSYVQSVFVKLNDLQFKFESYTEPSANPEDRKSNLYKICTDFNPLEVMIFLERVLIQDCPLPSEDDINIYVRTRQAFRLLESHWKDHNIEFSNEMDYFEKKE